MENNKNQIKSAVVSFIFAFILPLLAYGILKLLHFSDTLALGVATAFPVILTAYTAIKKRKINPLGLIAICGFLISLVAVYLSHGNDLAFKLWHPILTGSIGVVLLLSVAVKHPLMGVLDDRKAKKLEKDEPKITDQPENEEEIKNAKLYFMIFTLFMGLVFAAHAVGTILLAFAVSTTHFILISKGIDFGAILVLILGIFLINHKMIKE